MNNKGSIQSYPFAQINLFIISALKFISLCPVCECGLVGLQSVWQVAYIRTAGAW